MNELTKGNPAKVILTFAIPIFLSNILQIVYSLTDTRIVGSFLGENALAAVGAATAIGTLNIQFLVGVCNGFGVMTARFFGAKEHDNVRKSFANAMVLGLGIAAVLVALELLLLNTIMTILHVPQELLGLSKTYISIIIVGSFFTLLYNMFTAMMRAIGDSVTPLIILAVSVTLNIVGDLFFLVVLHKGVGGAAFATILAQFLSACVCFFYMRRRYEIFHLQKGDFASLDGELRKEMLFSGLSLGFMSSLINLGSFVLQTGINQLGNSYILAQTAARKISEIFMVMFGTFGHTIATYAGQNYGAGNYKRIRQGFRWALTYTLLWCGLSVILSFTVSPWMIYMVTGSNNAVMIRAASNYLKFDTCFYWVTAFICICRMMLQGIGDRVTPLISSCMEMLGKIVITMTLIPMLGYTGVIITEPIVWFIMVIPLLIQYCKNPILHGK